MTALFQEVAGVGEPALVFVHGLTCDHTDWVEQVAHFSPRHRCVSVDLPGHGRSPADGRALTIERFIDALAEHVADLDGPLVLFGHSMGCRVAIGTANRIGDRVVGVVAVDGSSFASGDPEAVRAAVLEKVDATGLRAMLEGMFRQMFTDASPPELVDAVMRRALAFDPVLGPGLIADMAAWDAACSNAMLDAVRVPLLAIQSTAVDASRNRRVLAPGETSPWTEAIEARVPGARIALLPGVGHFTMNEAPEPVNAQIGEFLSGLGAS